MRAFKLITALCSMGNTEGCGTFATPFKDDIADFMQDMFGGGNKIQIVGDILEDFNYVYSYDDVINNYLADAIVQIYDDNGNILSEIFLYEIED